jgi:hypothetical protein
MPKAKFKCEIEASMTFCVDHLGFGWTTMC